MLEQVPVLGEGEGELVLCRPPHPVVVVTRGRRLHTDHNEAFVAVNSVRGQDV